MDKKGELTSTQIVSITIGILALITMLFALTLIKFGEYTDEELCKLSVLGRAHAADSIQGSLPLKCSTKKICLTRGKGDCSENFAGEEIEKIKLSADDTKAARLIEEVSAREMYNCWSMMGEGKIDLFGKYATSRGLEVTDSTCLICSRVAIDKGISEDVIKKVDIHRYMKEELVPQSKLTYIQTFTDKVFGAYPSVDRAAYENEANSLREGDSLSGNGREIALLFMQIKATKASEVLSNLGKDVFLIAAGGYFVNLGAKGVAGVLVGKAIRFILLPVAIGTAPAAALNAYSGQITATGYCGEFSTNDEKAKEGCSIVQAMPYDANRINNFCKSIEGNP